MRREFDAKIWKTGNAHVITIPKKIIKRFKLKSKEYLEVIIKKWDKENKMDLQTNYKTAYKIGKSFEKKAIAYLYKLGFQNIEWVSKKKTRSPFDIKAEKNGKEFFIEVKYRKDNHFMINKEQFNRLKTFRNVLFLLISKENKKLVPLEKINQYNNISVTNDLINTLNLKKRNLNKFKDKSLLYHFLNRPRIKIIDFLLDNKPLDFSKGEIAREINYSKTIVYNVWNFLEKYNIVKISRKFGKTKLFTLNTKSHITQKILDLELSLIKQATKIKKHLIIPA